LPRARSLAARKPTHISHPQSYKLGAGGRAERARLCTVELHTGGIVSKLSNEERRQIILEALQPGANITQIARDHGISRRAIYKYFDYALDNPKQRMQDAEEEAAFRRKVWELVR
jgi:transposase-like protein